MAKSKKQQQEAKPAGAESSEKKAAGTKLKAKSVTAAPPMAPMIDTGLAASTAAKRVAHKEDLVAVPASSRESDSFKKLKEGLHKPIGSSMPSFLQNIAASKKSNNSVPGRAQIGRNQTFGADVNRTGVPRRTGGG